MLNKDLLKIIRLYLLIFFIKYLSFFRFPSPSPFPSPLPFFRFPFPVAIFSAPSLSSAAETFRPVGLHVGGVLRRGLVAILRRHCGVAVVVVAAAAAGADAATAARRLQARDFRRQPLIHQPQRGVRGQGAQRGRLAQPDGGAPGGLRYIKGVLFGGAYASLRRRTGAHLAQKCLPVAEAGR